MHEVVYRGWIFEVDQQATQLAYSKRDSGNADGCSCSDCENYRSQRRDAFPPELLELFERLGLDYRKESEAFAVEDLNNGFVRYGGWFHFAGRILKGPDCKRPITKDAWAMELEQVAPRFKVGFTAGDDLSVFDDKGQLVQVEFETQIPWVIDRPRESET